MALAGRVQSRHRKIAGDDTRGLLILITGLGSMTVCCVTSHSLSQVTARCFGDDGPLKSRCRRTIPKYSFRQRYLGLIVVPLITPGAALAGPPIAPAPAPGRVMLVPLMVALSGVVPTDVT